MNKKTKPQISAAMTAMGVLTAHSALLDEKVREFGGQPEDLYPLGRREDPKVVELVSPIVRQLVAWGNESRAACQKSVLIPPQFAFTCALQPRHLFILNKSGADAVTLLSRMDGTHFVTNHGKGMMGAPECVIGPTETALVGVYACDQLSVTGWAETDFFGPRGWEHVKRFGLTQCLPDDGPYIRIAHPKQELGEWFRVVNDPISFDGYSFVWCVAHVSGRGRCLYGWDLGSDDRLNADNLVALRLATLFISSPLFGGGVFLLELSVPAAEHPAYFANGTDKAAYFLLSSDFVSHKTKRRTLNMSILRIASRTHGCFSAGVRKLAAAIASIASMSVASTF